jgi:hypothetical protein
MTTKTFHGFMLWAVPRFHRSDNICPEARDQKHTGGLLHQFSTPQLEEPVRETQVLTRETATCH